MKLKVLGSNSKGNCYLLISSSGQTLVLDAGVGITEVKDALSYKIDEIVGVLCTHIHKDHSLSIKDFARYAIPIYSCNDVADKFDGVAVLELEQPYAIGEFIVTAFQAYHNVECYSYLIEHNDMGRLFFATDTNKVPYKFRELNHILIEANYSLDVKIDNAMDNHWSRSASENHLSLDRAIDFVGINKTVSLQNVLLIHLSEDNADPKLFRERFLEEFGLRVQIAKKGIEINLNREEF